MSFLPIKQVFGQCIFSVCRTFSTLLSAKQNLSQLQPMHLSPLSSKSLKLSPLDISAKRDTFKDFFIANQTLIDSQHRSDKVLPACTVFMTPTGSNSLEFFHFFSQNVEFRCFFRFDPAEFRTYYFHTYHFPSSELCLEDAILSVVFNCLENFIFFCFF